MGIYLLPLLCQVDMLTSWKSALGVHVSFQHFVVNSLQTLFLSNDTRLVCFCLKLWNSLFVILCVCYIPLGILSEELASSNIFWFTFIGTCSFTLRLEGHTFFFLLHTRVFKTDVSWQSWFCNSFFFAFPIEF